MPNSEDQEQYVLGISTAAEVDEILQKAIRVSVDDDDPEMLVLECYNPN